MRDIREDLLQRRLSIVSRYFEAMTLFDEQLQKLHEGHRKLMADIQSEKGTVDAMLAIENNRSAYDIKDADSQTTSVLLRSLSEIVQQFPREKFRDQQDSTPGREREASMLQNSANNKQS
jgi:hypothetical protein